MLRSESRNLALHGHSNLSSSFTPLCSDFPSSTVVVGGQEVSQLSATISPHKYKKVRLSPPEDDQVCLKDIVMVDSVRNAIWTALNHYAYDDAVFAAERLYAEEKSDENAFLLATSLYRSGDVRRAYSILTQCHPEKASSDIRYLYGKICCDLEEYQKAEAVLSDTSEFGKPYALEDVENLYKKESASYALQVLGNIHQKSERSDLAAETFRRACALNPFQWTSFETVCKLKKPIDVKETFLRSVCSNAPSTSALPDDESIAEPSSSFKQSQDVDMAPVDNNNLPVTPVMSSDLVRPSVVKKPPVKAADRSGALKPRMRSICEESNTPQPSQVSTPVMSPSPMLRASNGGTPQSGLQLIHADGRVSTSAKKVKPKQSPFKSSLANSAVESPPVTRSRRQSDTIYPTQTSTQLRRSSRVANKALSNVKENKVLKKRDEFGSDLKLEHRFDKEDNLIKVEDVDLLEISENGIIVSPSKSTAENEAPQKEPVASRPKRKKEPASLEPSSTTAAEEPSVVIPTCDQFTSRVMKSYCRFGEVVQALHKYDALDAFEKLNGIPEEQTTAPFYWYLKGRVHFELLEYDRSVAAFAEMRRRDPFYIKGIDYYSVALWQLQKEKELAVLAKYLIEHHRHAPETYIVYGNVFSLQRDHETAVKMFRRALQISPDYAYALTLLGHEYVSLDEKEKAAQSFRMAIHSDPFHYNGWCGLGQLSFKQEQFSAALANFNRALEIYPKNPIILVHRGTAQHQLKLSNEALHTFTTAVNLYPNNPLCRFQRASLLYSMNRLDEAMVELQKLKDIAPKESLVYFLLGKVSKRTEDTHKALMYFAKAMDLDPKGTNNQIKEAFNKLYGGIEDEIVPQRTGGSPRNSDVL